jgi:hypothetical protein
MALGFWQTPDAAWQTTFKPAPTLATSIGVCSEVPVLNFIYQLSADSEFWVDLLKPVLFWGAAVALCATCFAALAGLVDPQNWLNTDLLVLIGLLGTGYGTFFSTLLFLSRIVRGLWDARDHYMPQSDKDVSMISRVALASYSVFYFVAVLSVTGTVVFVFGLG